jgi:creatinine amidohydrolase
MTSPEVRTLCSNGDVDVLLPMGAIEQHGPHLPLNVDVLIAEEVASLVVTRLISLGINVVVAPTFVYGDSSHHLDFSGTISLSNDALVSSLRDICESLIKSGFRRIFIVTGHAGNCSAMKQVENELGQSRVTAIADWPIIRGRLHKVAAEQLGMSADIVGTHAGHFETSIMMLIAGTKVRKNLFEIGAIGNAQDLGTRLREFGMYEISKNGIIGDLTTSSESAGKIYLDALVDLHVEIVTDRISQVAS